MVDYKQPQSVSTPPSDILKIQILERRHYAINAIQEYKKLATRTGAKDVGTHVIQAAVYSLYLEIAGSMNSNMRQEIEKKADSTNFKELLDAFNQINNYLYEKKLTRFDSRADIDSTDIEAVNREHGL